MKREVMDQIVALLASECSELGEDLDALEAEVLQRTRQLGQEAVQAVLKKKGGYHGASRPCECGQRGRFVGYRDKTVLTSLGAVTVRRAYYHCPSCRRGQIPYDQQSGLGPGQLSNHLASAVSLLASQTSFDQAGRMLEELLGVRVDDNTIAQTAERVGAVVLERNDAAVTGALERRNPPKAQVHPERLYISTDGTTAPTLDGWREVKCGAVYWDDPVEGRQLRYAARLEGCESFGQRLWYLACECGLRQAEEVVVLGDGAPWIWNQARLRFSRSKQILDWYHASEHIWQCANGLYGEGKKAGASWANRMLKRLYEHGGRALLKRLRRSRRSRRKSPEVLLELIGYVVSNVDRMDYPAYRSAGLDIGSGPVESACKRLVGGRLKGPGMRWSVPGAESVLALRIAWFNGQWEELWKSKPLAA